MRDRDGDRESRLFVRLLWAIPPSVLLHNLEEYPRIVDYAHRHGIAINRRQMGIAVLLATLLPLPVTVAATKQPADRRRLQLALAIPALMAFNAGAHLAQTILLRDRSPGTITGVGVNIPLALLLYRRALRDGVLTPDELRKAAIIGASAMAPAALLLQLIGWGVDRVLAGTAARRDVD